MTAHAAAARRAGAVERVGGDLLVGPRDPAVGAVGRAAGDSRPDRRGGDASAVDRTGRRRLMALRAELVAAAAVVDVHPEREVVRRAVRQVAVRAGDRAGLEATRQGERLRTIEAVGAAVRPEVTLGIELRQRLTEQRRQGIILVALPGAEGREDVALVAVAVGAAVEGAARIGRAWREDPERLGELPVGGARAVARHRRRIPGPALGQRDVVTAGTVAGLAADAELGPLRAVRGHGRLVAAIEIGGMAVEAVDVPDLLHVVRAIGNRRGLLPVEPSAARHVPEHRQHVHPSIRQRRKIALEALRSQGVVHPVGLSRSIARPQRHRRRPIGPAERVGAAVRRERGAAREVAEHGRLGDRARHLDVERGPPLRVGLLMARLAGRRSRVLRRRRRGDGRDPGGRGGGRLTVAARGHPRAGHQQARGDAQQQTAGAHRSGASRNAGACRAQRRSSSNRV